MSKEIKIMWVIVTLALVVLAFFIGMQEGRSTIEDPDTNEICEYSESQYILKGVNDGKITVRVVKTIICDKPWK